MEFNPAKLSELWIKTINTQTKCMFGNCDKLAIKSHVLQKNGIIRQIAEKNHLMHLKAPNVFDIIKGNKDRFGRIGVNDVYTFFGFCNEHNTKFFEAIENKATLNLFDPIHQGLFCYRGLCQEITRKIQVKSFQENGLPYLPFNAYPFVRDSTDG